MVIREKSVQGWCGANGGKGEAGIGLAMISRTKNKDFTCTIDYFGRSKKVL